MKKNLLLFLFFSVSFLQAQDSVTKAPRTLDECYVYLDSIFSDDEKDVILNAESPSVMNKYHFGVGLFIRNKWIRNGAPSLIALINYKPWKVSIDDLGAVVLTGYWHYLHRIEFRWDGILESAEDYYESCKVPAPASP